MSGQSNEYKLQFILEMKNAIAELEKAYALYVQFKEPVDAKVNVKLSTDDAVKKLQQVGEELGRTKQKLDDLTKATNQKMMQIAESVKIANAAVAGLGDAFISEGKEGREAIQQLLVQLKKLPKDMQVSVADSLSEAAKLKKEILATGDAAESLRTRAKRGVQQAQGYFGAIQNAANGGAVPPKTATAVAQAAQQVSSQVRASRGTRNTMFPDEATALAYVNATRQQYAKDFESMASAVNKTELSGMSPADVQARFKSGIDAYNRFRQRVMEEMAALKEAGDKGGAGELNQLYSFARKNYLTPFTDNSQAVAQDALRRGRNVITGRFDPTRITQEEGQDFARVWMGAQREQQSRQSASAMQMLAPQEFQSNYNHAWDTALGINERGILSDQKAQASAQMLAQKFASGYAKAWDEAISEDQRGILSDQKADAASRMLAVKFEAGYNRAWDQAMAQDAGMGAAGNKQNSDYWMAKMRSGREGPTSGVGKLVNSGLALFGGVQLAYTSYNTIRNAMKEYEDFTQKIAEVQATLSSRNPFDAQNLAEGVGKAALKYGIDLNDAADAAKEFAHVGMNVRDVIKELDSTFAAARGVGLNIKQVQDLQLAIRTVTEDNDKYSSSVNYTTVVLDKIAAVQSRYAVNAQDLAAGLKTLTPILEEFTNGLAGMNDSFDYGNALITVMVEKLRITGTQAQSVMKMVFSRLSRPEVTNKLTSQFGVKLKNEDTGDILPIDQLVNTLGHTYKMLGEGKDGGIQQKQFANLLSGGRNINAVTALLQDYSRVGEIAAVSANSFGDAQARAGIVTDSLATKVGRLKTAFTLYTKGAVEATGISGGLAGVIGVLVEGFTKFPIATTLAVAGLYKGVTALYKYLGAMEAVTEFSSGAGLSQGLGTMAGFLGPAGVILAGVTAILGVWGLISSHMNAVNEEMERYKIHLRDVSQIQDSPQYSNFRDTASSVGLISPDAGALGFDRGYKTVQDALVGPGRAAFKGMEGDIQEFGRLTDLELRRLFEQSPEKFTKFQKDFSKIFISQLPEETRKAFSGMATDSSRIAKAIELIGGAAFSATYQMRSAIEDLNAATNRMMDDTLKKLAAIQEEKDHPGFLKKYLGIEFGSGNLYDTSSIIGNLRPGQGIVTSPAAVLDLLRKQSSGLPVYQAILNDPTLQQALLKTINPSVFSGGKFVGADVLAGGLSHITQDKGLYDRLKVQMLARTGTPEAMLALQTYSPAFLQQNGVSAEMIKRTQQMQAQKNVITDVQTEGDQKLKKANPAAEYLDLIDRLIKMAGSPVTAGLLDNTNGVTSALAGFRDQLLKTATDVYEAFHKFVEDRDFAEKFGQAYDRGGALVNLGRGLRGKLADSDTDFEKQVVELFDHIKKLPDLTSPTKGPDGKSVHADQKEATKLQQQIDTTKQQLAAFNTQDIGAIFGTSTEGIELRNKFLDALQKAGAGDYTTLKALLTQWPDVAIKLGLKMQDQDARALQNADLMNEALKKRNELAIAELPITATALDKAPLLVKAAQDEYQAQQARLALQVKNGQMGIDEYNRKKDSLAVEFQINSAYEARTGIATAQHALDQQTLQNIKDMSSGVKTLLTDGSIWDKILSPSGATASERWRQSANALRDLLFNTITPIFKTISDRFVETMFKNIAESLMSVSAIKKFAGMGEQELKENLTGAQVAATISDSFIAAGAAVASMLAAALGNTAFVPNAMGAGAVVVANGQKSVTDAQNTADQVKKMATYSGIGLTIGQLGGTLLGKGGQYAQQGSQIGSVAGLLGAAGLAKLGGTVGTFFGGPLGTAVGAGLGGILGGLLGGAHDGHQHDQEQPVIKSLDAIERAQRDTITTIQNQTSALLNPENRFFGLPSTFNTPAYAAAFGLGGGGSVNIDKVEVNVTNPGASASEISSAVETAMGNVLNKQRLNQSWV